MSKIKDGRTSAPEYCVIFLIFCYFYLYCVWACSTKVLENTHMVVFYFTYMMMMMIVALVWHMYSIFHRGVALMGDLCTKKRAL